MRLVSVSCPPCLLWWWWWHSDLSVLDPSAAPTAEQLQAASAAGQQGGVLGREMLRKTISVNDPFRYNGITMYQVRPQQRRVVRQLWRRQCVRTSGSSMGNRLSSWCAGADGLVAGVRGHPRAWPRRRGGASGDHLGGRRGGRGGASSGSGGAARGAAGQRGDAADGVARGPARHQRAAVGQLLAGGVGQRAGAGAGPGAPRRVE